jgi:cytochrome c biogenesis protein
VQNIFRNRLLKQLANLKFAIVLLLVIGVLISLSTFIEQEQGLEFYKQNYPSSSAIFGFIDWKLITFLSLDKIYTASWFILIVFLFVMSLLACTLTVQLPSLKNFRGWKFFNRLISLSGLKENVRLEDRNTFLQQLHRNNYHIFNQSTRVYSYSGLLGRVGPIIVHASIILLLLGSAIGTFQGYTSQEMVPRGEVFRNQNLIASGPINYLLPNLSWRVNDFWVTYSEDSKISQFYSDISLLKNFSQEIKRKTIFVNEPLTFKGLNLYQTDWDILGIKIKTEVNNVIQVPIKKITTAKGKLWVASLPLLNNGNNKTLTIIVKNLQGNIYLYRENGTFLTEVSIGNNFSFDSQHSLTFIDFVTSTGLQLKFDPGINIVFVSFFLLILSIFISFISYSQIWGVEENRKVNLVGKSNRAVLFFQTDFDRMIRKTKLKQK